MAEGILRWEGGWTWYRVEGDLRAADAAPLVLLHGGPGGAHDYLEPLTELTRIAARPCVLYDQIGCGRSQHLPDAPAGFWTVELFRRELEVLLDELGLAGRHQVLGHSWGGMLGMEYAVRQPPGLRALVIADSPASMPLWIEETRRLRRLLPADVQGVLAKHEAAARSTTRSTSRP